MGLWMVLLVRVSSSACPIQFRLMISSKFVDPIEIQFEEGHLKMLKATKAVLVVSDQYLKGILRSEALFEVLSQYSLLFLVCRVIKFTEAKKTYSDVTDVWVSDSHSATNESGPCELFSF